MKRKKWTWVLAPLYPILWVLGFVQGAIQGWKDSKIVFRCDDGDVTIGELKKWSRPPYGMEDNENEPNYHTAGQGGRKKHQ